MILGDLLNNSIERPEVVHNGYVDFHHGIPQLRHHMDNSAPDIFDRFVQHLRAVDGRNSGDRESGRLVVFEEGSPRHASFLTTTDDLGAHLSALAEDAQLIWPEATSELAAFRLLSIHLQESLSPGGPDPRRLTADGIFRAPSDSPS
ncbi:hypothetical protein GCM10022202_27050 [Microbacterium marinilacus]|uniref:Uncharacterized protein n=1 Tax=Microbacterium marinilacus TaxID=415209 RepID=A0ABP7BNK5_9MICO